jgi:hypothetical protein
LEQVVVLNLLLFVRERVERFELVVLVDLHERVDDPVVVPIESVKPSRTSQLSEYGGQRERGNSGNSPREDHHECASRRRHQEQPLRRNDVVKDLAILESANLVLLRLIVSLLDDKDERSVSNRSDNERE